MIPRYLINFDLEKLPKSISDVLVIGSGVAGLSVALRAGEFCRVSLLTKSELGETTTRYAQGGIAAAVGEGDSPEYHFKDTIEAGDGLCDPTAVRILVEEGPARLKELIAFGAHFDFTGNHLSLSLEGGHSMPRVVHARGDATGREVELALVNAVRKNPQIEIYENIFVLDLFTHNGHCVGALTFGFSGTPQLFLAKAVVLAAGGMGQLFKVTTNPPISTGDGIAMSYRAGAEIADVEFIQFHPTALYENGNPRFLITEAIRGEGAVLRDARGRRFMDEVHPLADLAPRDTVVREMVKAMKSDRKDYLFLDATSIPSDKLKKSFPTIYQKCLRSGIDISKDYIPVAPAAHYMSGGLWTNLEGKTNLPGLYACGEVACTGVHGANRLASNSLLEGLVLGKRISDILNQDLAKASITLDQITISYQYPRRNKKVKVDQVRQKLQETMTSKVGVIRSKTSLEEATNVIESMSSILDVQFNSVEGFELQNMILLAKLIIRAALMREESRGAHYRDDFPKVDDTKWRKRIVFKDTEQGMRVRFEEVAYGDN